MLSAFRVIRINFLVQIFCYKSLKNFRSGDKSNRCLKQFSTKGHLLVGNHGPTSGEIYGPGGDFPH